METLQKRFILKDNMTKLNYDVSLGNSAIGDVSLPDYTLQSILGDVILSDVALQDISLDATLTDVEIKEY
jgi:hypothetical protein